MHLKTIITTVALVLQMLICTVPAEGSDVRSRATGDTGQPFSKGVPINQQQYQTIRQVQAPMPSGQEKRNGGLARLAGKNTNTGQARVSSSGAMLQGMKIDILSGEKQWCELTTDGSIKPLWNTPSTFINTGFIRQGKIYGFSSQAFMGYAFLGHGVFGMDGTLMDWTDDDDYFDNFSRYVIQCAYDADADVAYAYTLNSDASAYMFQKIDPETSTFTVINDNVPLEEICNGMTWNASDGMLYGFTSDCRVCRIDTNTGSLTQLVKIMGYGISTACHGMVYSPLDKAYFIVICNNDLNDTPMVRVDPSVWTYAEVAKLPFSQFPILECDDKPMADEAPLAPVITSIDFDGAALSGTAVITAPERTFGGDILNGQLTLSISVDDSVLPETVMTPGETKSIPLDLTEGKHTLRFKISDASGIESPIAERTIYTGYDVPAAPEKVTFGEGTVMWTPVTEGLNGAYIDPEGPVYDVYLDGTAVATSVKGTEYSFDMPDWDYGVHTAGVAAVNHTQRSAITYSNSLLTGRSLELPLDIKPEEEQLALLETVDVNEDFYGWEKYISYDGSIQCSTYTAGASDDWLLLPPVAMPASEKLYKISFEIRSGDPSTPDALELAWSDSDNIADMNTISRYNVFSDDYTTEETFIYAPSDCNARVGFHAVSPGSGGGLYIRNIKVELSDSSSERPSAPTILSAVATPEGALSAEVMVKMPVKDAAGRDLQADSKLQCVALCGEEKVTTSAAPGEEVSFTLQTLQGFNNIKVYATRGDEDGFPATVSIFTGEDVPTAISSLIATPTDDNMGVVLSWMEPESGMNGGYVRPGSTQYYLCRQDENNEWQIVRELGNTTSCRYDMPADSPLAIEYFAIACGNELGINPMIRLTKEMLGTPYNLPLEESFDGYEVHCTPVLDMADNSEYSATWTSGGNSWLEAPAEGENFTCWANSDNTQSKGLLMLPRFTTEGCKDPALDFTVLHHSKMGKLNVYAMLQGGERQIIGTIDASGYTTPEWVKHRVALGSIFANKKAVTVLLESEFTHPEQNNVIDGYKIRNVKEKEFDSVVATVTPFVKVGGKLGLSLSLENAGVQSVALPTVTVDLLRDGNKLMQIKLDTDSEGELPIFGKADYSGEFVTNAEVMGKLECRFEISGTEIAVTSTDIYADMDPVVSDLKAEYDGESSVRLSWTEPEIPAGFENFERLAGWCYPDSIGEFENVDRDGLPGNYFTYYSFPYDRAAKAFQIFSESEFADILHSAFPDDVNFMTAYSGDKFAVSIAPFGAEADDWFISPEITGGSDVLFMASIVAGYMEEMEVLYSTESSDPDSFIMLEREAIMTEGWKGFEYKLPADARYFAIRHIGNNFALCIDDLKYSPANAPAAIDHYELMRDGVCVNSNVATGGSAADNYSLSGKVSYYIVPVLDGRRGMMSNTATVEVSSVSDIDNTHRLFVDGDAIVAEGCEGSVLRIWSADGIMIEETLCTDRTSVTMPSGVYVATVAGMNLKCIIK